MANYRIGDYIRLSRKVIGMSQEELAFQAGVATETISRIESGKHKITQSVYQSIMTVLNRHTERSFGICNSDEVGIIEEKQLLEDAEAKYEDEKVQRYLSVVREKAQKNKVNQQYIMRVEAYVDFDDGKIDMTEFAERLEACLKITVEDYRTYWAYEDETKVCYPFSEQEILILMNLADTYAKMKRFEESERIDRMILRCLELGYMGGQTINNLRLVIMRNYAKSLSAMKRYGEALELLKRAFTDAVKEKNGTIMSPILYEMGWNMKKINEKFGEERFDIDDIKRKMRQARYVAAARKDLYSKNVIDNMYLKFWDEEFNSYDV